MAQILAHGKNCCAEPLGGDRDVSQHQPGWVQAMLDPSLPDLREGDAEEASAEMIPG